MSRPICNVCNINPVGSTGKNRLGKKCGSCRKKPWTVFKKDVCQLCGFVPVHRVQLDVDHIDANKMNNDPNNLQTLCANCHRLKTYLNSDWLNKEQAVIDTLQMGLDL